MSTTLLSAFYDIDFLCKVGRSVVPQARPGAPGRCRGLQDGAPGGWGRGDESWRGGRPTTARDGVCGRFCGRFAA